MRFATHCSLLSSVWLLQSVEAASWKAEHVLYGADKDLDCGNFGGPFTRDDACRQHLHIAVPDGTGPFPVLVYAHENGVDVDMPSSAMESILSEGVAIVSWESVSSLGMNNADDIAIGQQDLQDVFSWISGDEVYGLDATHLIVSGTSRGTLMSWSFAHTNPAVKSIYMHDALPNPFFSEALTSIVSQSSPPLYFTYDPKCPEPILADCSVGLNPHNPANGQAILDVYEEKGNDNYYLKQGLDEENVENTFQYFPSFMKSLEDEKFPQGLDEDGMYGDGVYQGSSGRVLPMVEALGAALVITIQALV